MCGRVQLRLGARETAAAFEATLGCAGDLFRRFNAAPSQRLPLLRPAAGRERRLMPATWGHPLGPGSAARRPINARSETAATGPAFARSFRLRRAALPVTGFYEWQKPDPDAAPPLFGGDPARATRRAWCIDQPDGRPFALAALASEPVAAEPPGFCVLTTRPNEAMARVHDRMPVLLDAAGLRAWLDPSTPADQLAALTQPVAPEALRFTPVSARINAPAHEGPGALQPLGDGVAGATFARSAAL